MIISNQCLGSELELRESPVPITVVEDPEGQIAAICSLRVGDKCLARDAHKLDDVKKEVSKHPHSNEAHAYPGCLYSREGLKLV